MTGTTSDLGFLACDFHRKVCFTINVATLNMDRYSKALCAFQDVVAAINKFNSHVVGVPVTLNGDLNNQFVQPNVGFDTICKVNSQLISNVCTDALSVEKYYYFIRLMGRKASHVALECTLQSHPNMVILGEEVAASKLTIFDLTKQIRDAVQARAEEGAFSSFVLSIL
ncbi:hypothetical protein L2E82_48619 [Cichorium intybus]|uniref:Uncharacterized protein n=1 Tax=Cichorium intybus TaxID=13427 RepID=A0ACB8YZR6_CICIN|nr:hypothetical protein L2E82_48619 [Cichorium intybus]